MNEPFLRTQDHKHCIKFEALYDEVKSEQTKIKKLYAPSGPRRHSGVEVAPQPRQVWPSCWPSSLVFWGKLK